MVSLPSLGMNTNTTPKGHSECACLQYVCHQCATRACVIMFSHVDVMSFCQLLPTPRAYQRTPTNTTSHVQAYDGIRLNNDSVVGDNIWV